MVLLYYASSVLTLNDNINKILDILALVLIIIFGAVFLSKISVLLLNKFLQIKNKETENAGIIFIGKTIKFIVWVAALFILLENMGIKVTAIVAGLGIGGIAIAFSAQALLEDVFGYFSILFDKPFELDDFIVTGSYMGNVENIGIKTTRLRSINGEQIIVSNKLLLNNYVQNYKNLASRRVVFKIGVTYNTSCENLNEIPIIIKKIINDTKLTSFDRVHFVEFSDFSLDYEIVYYVLSNDYNVYMDVRHKINLSIKEEFDKRKIEFALPTQTLHFTRN